MRIMANFDTAIAQVLNEKVKARLNFKVRACPKRRRLGSY
jgi:hypothetical protein